MDIKLIKPRAKGNSDKYSWNLWRYLEKNPYNIKVYWNRKNEITGEWEDFNPSNVRTRRIILGKMYDCLSGSVLQTIMGDRRDKFQVWSFHSIAGWKNDQFQEITDWFWDYYIKFGRCLFDKEHTGWWQGDENRFTYINNTRRCNWCGQWQEKVRTKKVIIKREEVWVNQK